MYNDSVGLFGLLALRRRATRLVFLLMALAVAAPVVNYLWPTAVHDIVESVKADPTTTTTP